MDTVETNTENAVGQDHYQAFLEEGELVIQPFCACGNPLNEDYFCEKCNRHCRCYLIICQDVSTLERVRLYIRRAPQFALYRAQLAGA